MEGKDSGQVLERGIKETAELCNLGKEKLGGEGERAEKRGVGEKVERGKKWFGQQGGWMCCRPPGVRRLGGV